MFQNLSDFTASGQLGQKRTVKRHAMITCYVRYELNPDKIDEFEEYARMWVPLVEKHGGTHHGYYLPHESANDLAVTLFSFPSLAAYEEYRTASKNDPECQKAFEFAEKMNSIRRYDRQFLRPLEI
ncbi:NIPSNAP protein [Aliiroseovarius crassostreae]|nr:NIPSNAP protein [Aliiroseovarius crassostreae]